MSQTLLQVRDLKVEFPVGGVWLPAVRELSFTLDRGEALGLVGESGSGKSVTALALLRLLPPQARVTGEIRFQGRDLPGLEEEAMRQVRGAGISMIFQEPMTALNPVMRVGDQVAEAVRAHGQSPVAGRQSPEGQSSVVGPRSSAKISKGEAWKRAIEAMKDVGLGEAERRARDYPHQLSGGMRQRVMIAMAIVNRPQLLIADEPTTALDVTIQAQILELLAELRRKFGLALLFISHDLAVVSKVAERVAVMYGGSLVEVGPAAEVLRAPAHPYTRGLLKAVPTLRSQRGRPLETVEGTVPALTALPPGCAFEPRCGLRVAECAHALPPLVEIAPGHLARCPVVKNST